MEIENEFCFMIDAALLFNKEAFTQNPTKLPAMVKTVSGMNKI